MAPSIEKIALKLSAEQLTEILDTLAATSENFMWFGGLGSKWTVVPIKPELADWNDYVKSTLLAKNSCSSPLPFTGGTVGLIPYETFTEYSDGETPLAFACKGALVCDNLSGETYICSSLAKDFRKVADAAKKLLHASNASYQPKIQPIRLIADRTDEQYETMIKTALEDIRNGRYYQINLLRYFKTDQSSPANLTQLLSSRGGPFSSWFRFGGKEVVSFSPEQFVEVKQQNGKGMVSTSPIKGTAARHPDPAVDQRSADELLKSSKNLAELHMIIDLMRNDLNRICQPGSVTVKEKNKPLTFANVHHLVGTIEGQLRDEVTVGEFLRAVCPGGSITGAPKIEVVRAIREFEGRPRGYFMGHAFMQDTYGTFNSSVLIRTLSGSVGKAYEFSAGSGIVIHSDPTAERLEIDAKCNVLNPQEHS